MSTSNKEGGFGPPTIDGPFSPDQPQVEPWLVGGNSISCIRFVRWLEVNGHAEDIEKLRFQLGTYRNVSNFAHYKYPEEFAVWLAQSRLGLL